MKYLVINLSDFTVLTENMVDEEGDLKVAKVFDCLTSATFAAGNLALGTVVIYAQDVLNLVDKKNEEQQRLNQRIQNQQTEIDSLTAIVDELNDLRPEN